MSKRKYRTGDKWRLVDGETLEVTQSASGAQVRYGKTSYGRYICRVSDQEGQQILTAQQITRLTKSATKL